jgi:hypothetical protein
MKTDFGFSLFFILTTYIFNFESIHWVIIDTLVAIVLSINVFLMRSAVNFLIISTASQ